MARRRKQEPRGGKDRYVVRAVAGDLHATPHGKYSALSWAQTFLSRHPKEHGPVTVVLEPLFGGAVPLFRVERDGRAIHTTTLALVD